MGIHTVFLLQAVWAVHFLITDRSEMCFTLDLPSQAVVLGNYNLFDLPPATMPEDGVVLKVTDPLEVPVLHRLVRDCGKYAFTTQIQGIHRICVFVTNKEWTPPDHQVKFELTFDNVESEISHEAVANVDQVTHLTTIAESLTDRLRDITKKQEYSLEKEANFHEESEQINSRILYLTLLQTCIILGSGTWQLYSLWKFFKAKKLL